jgi:hypothetical protein
MHDSVAREVIGQGPPCGATTIEGLDPDGIRRGTLGRGFLQVLQRQFQLFDPGAALRRSSEPLPSKPRDLELQPFDLDIEGKTGRGSRLLGREPGLPLRPDHRVGGGKVGWKRLSGDLHLRRRA